MTQQEAVLLLETKLQTRGYLLYGNLEPEEIDLFLLKATNDFIDSILNSDHDDRETSQDYLRYLRVTSGDLNPASTQSDSVLFNLPSDYRDYIQVSAQTQTGSSGCQPDPTWNGVDIIDSEKIWELNDDSYYGTHVESVNGIIEGSQLRLYKNSTFDVLLAKMLYYKQPTVWDIQGSPNDTYPLTNKAIYRIIDIATVEIATFVEQRQEKIANLKG